MSGRRGHDRRVTANVDDSVDSLLPLDGGPKTSPSVSGGHSDTNSSPRQGRVGTA